MRKQYHFRPSLNGYYAWDVDRLIALASCETPQLIALSDIAELDENWWFQHGEVPSGRLIAMHLNILEEADMRFPIILDSEGRLMDGMHRAVKALARGDEEILGVRLSKTPDPDFTDVQPNELGK